MIDQEKFMLYNLFIVLVNEISLIYSLRVLEYVWFHRGNDSTSVSQVEIFRKNCWSSLLDFTVTFCVMSPNIWPVVLTSLSDGDHCYTKFNSRFFPSCSFLYIHYRSLWCPVLFVQSLVLLIYFSSWFHPRYSFVLHHPIWAQVAPFILKIILEGRPMLISLKDIFRLHFIYLW